MYTASPASIQASRGVAPLTRSPAQACATARATTDSSLRSPVTTVDEMKGARGLPTSASGNAGGSTTRSQRSKR
jgi:hypothetical protein